MSHHMLNRVVWKNYWKQAKVQMFNESDSSDADEEDDELAVSMAHASLLNGSTQSLYVQFLTRFHRIEPVTRLRQCRISTNRSREMPYQCGLSSFSLALDRKT